MKSKRNTYFFIGTALIVFNIVTDILNMKEYKKEDMGYNIGYFIGSHLLLIIGLFLYRSAYKLNRKLKSEGSDSVNNDIERIGNN